MARLFTDEERMAAFWAKVQPLENGCKQWTAAKTKQGYGHFQGGPGIGTQIAHRWIYEKTVGPIPPGLTIDHLCRDRSCVEVEHMDLVTNHENQLRGDRNQNGGKEFCLRGHRYDRIWRDRRTGHFWRQCSECVRIRKRDWRKRNPEHTRIKAKQYRQAMRQKKLAGG